DAMYLVFRKVDVVEGNFALVGRKNQPAYAREFVAEPVLGWRLSEIVDQELGAHVRSVHRAALFVDNPSAVWRHHRVPRPKGVHEHGLRGVDDEDGEGNGDPAVSEDYQPPVG